MMHVPNNLNKEQSRQQRIQVFADELVLCHFFLVEREDTTGESYVNGTASSNQTYFEDSPDSTEDDEQDFYEPTYDFWCPSRKKNHNKVLKHQNCSFRLPFYRTQHCFRSRQPHG